MTSESDAKFEVVHGLDRELVPGVTYCYNLQHIAPSDYAFGQVSAEPGRGGRVQGELQATIALGYPAESPAPRQRKPLRDVVRWEG